jgi:hypothetical protein
MSEDRQSEDGAKEKRIRQTLDAEGFIFFFKKGDEYYGTGEDGRVVFARIKNPDEEDPEGWRDEATFTAVNLNKLVHGETSQRLFSKRDTKGLKVVDQDDVVAALKDEDLGTAPKVNTISVIRVTAFRPKGRFDAPNFHRADEE